MGVWHSIAQQKKAQAGRSWDLADAAKSLALIDVAGLTARIYPPRPRTAKGKVMGRPAYSRQAIVRALLLVVHPYVAAPNVAALIRQLNNNPALRAVCGFDGGIPSQQVFGAVCQRLGETPDLLAELFVALTNSVKDGRPDFCKVIAVDSTTASTHCNPNRRARRVFDAELARYAAEDEAERQKAVAAGKGDRLKRRIRREETSDPEASWTGKNQAAVGVQLQGARLMRCGNRTADCGGGYNRQSRRFSDAAFIAGWRDVGLRLVPAGGLSRRLGLRWRRQLLRFAGTGLLAPGVAPVLRKRGLKPGKLRYGVYAGDGALTCKDGVPLDYVRTDDDTSRYVYRLPSDCVVATGGSCFRRKVRARALLTAIAPGYGVAV